MLTPRDLWLTLHEPRSITALHIIGYTTLLIAGTAALASPPAAISAEWGGELTTAWGAGLLIGGALALVAVPRGIWWLERVGITLLITAAAMYLSVILTLHLTSAGNRLPQACIITYGIVSLAIRWLRIRHAGLDPTAGPDGYHPDTARDPVRT